MTSPSYHGLFILTVSFLWAASALAQVEDPPAPVKPPEGGVIWEISPEMKTALITAKGAVASAGTLEDGKTPALKVELAPTDGYPGIYFPCPKGGWDFSDYRGIKVEVMNASPDASAIVYLEIHSPKKEDEDVAPMAINAKKLEAGETMDVVIGFDGLMDDPATAVDRANVRSIRVNTAPSTMPVTLLITSLKAFTE